MLPVIDLLTPTEAALVADVSVRDINRAIDEKILPERLYTLANGRRLDATACPLVGFYFHAAKALTAEERGLVIRLVSERLAPESTDWTVRDGFLTVNLEEFVAGARKRRARLTEAREMVVEDPDILGGTPVICGTRIPVYDVAASVAAKLPRDRVHAAYPGLDDRTIDLAALYAAAIPPRGRPRRTHLPTAPTQVATTTRVARRRPA